MKSYSKFDYFVLIVNLNQIQWNPTFSVTSFIARISLFGRFTYYANQSVEKIVEEVNEKRNCKF